MIEQWACQSGWLFTLWKHPQSYIPARQSTSRRLFTKREGTGHIALIVTSTLLQKRLGIVLRKNVSVKEEPASYFLVLALSGQKPTSRA
jgi:hypothetical protein